MQNRKVLLVLLLLISSFTLFASSYKITIQNADKVKVKENLVVLSDNVKLLFTSVDENKKETPRTLTADEVVVNADLKQLEAYGGVELKEGDNVFSGEGVILNWDNLDVVVYEGKSSSSRKNASGDNVEFYATGESISYAGKQGTVMFHNGIISTTKNDPYWSIKAKRIGLLESDLYFEKATLRMGRVPILWVPYLFYPGTRLAFNPAIGLDSSKGKFINTTFELYGKYPNMGNDSSSDKGKAASIMSLMESGNKSTVRKGWIYTSEEDNTSPSDLEKWAKDNDNYMALTGDIYEKGGIALGYDTKNHFFDKKISVNSKGVFAYNNVSNYNKFRFALDNEIAVTWNKITLTSKIPIYSDPEARSTYFNRKTLFGLDSVFGATQTFPTTYSTGNSEYSWVLDGKTSFQFGKYSLSLDSIKSQIDWKWKYSDDKQKYKYQVGAATLPYVSISSSGTIFSWEGDSKTKKTEVTYSEPLAEQYYQEYLALNKDDATTPSDLPFTAISAPDATREIQKSWAAPSFITSYSYQQTFSNTYREKMQHDILSTAASGELKLSGRLPYNSFSANLNLNPTFKLTKNSRENKKSNSFDLNGTFNASVPVAGINYNLSASIFKLSKEQTGEEEAKKTDGFFKWDNNYVTSHYVEITRKQGNFTLSFRENLKPVKESMVPGISYSKNGFSASAGATIYLADDLWKKGKVTLNTSYSKTDKYSFYFNNTYDFEKEGWNGYSSTQNLTLQMPKAHMSFSETLELQNKFETKKMSLSAKYKDNTSATFTMSGKELKPESIEFKTGYSLSPVYAWKNRIGLSSSLNTNILYNFENKYGTSFSIDFTLGFAISKFIDIALSVKSGNTSFFKYYDENDKFSFNLMFEDLLNSFAIFDSYKRTHTGFNMKSLTFSLVHYMEDWNLQADVSANIVTVNNRPQWKPTVSVYVKWKAIPELKVENKWNSIDGWDTK